MLTIAGLVHGTDWDSKKLCWVFVTSTRPISRPSLWCCYRGVSRHYSYPACLLTGVQKVDTGTALLGISYWQLIIRNTGVFFLSIDCDTAWRGRFEFRILVRASANICKLQNARCLMDKTSHSIHTQGMHLITFINDGLGPSTEHQEEELGVSKMIRMGFSHWEPHTRQRA